MRKRNTERTNTQPMRFAHPFFTNEPIAERSAVKNVGVRMTDYIADTLEKIPAPIRTSAMKLADIIGTEGAKEIEASGSVSFHAVGDTGHENGTMQEYVAEAMAADYIPDNFTQSPAFLFHLGDVIYYDNTDKGYQSQFYVPYKKYPGKIIAIPGNHDGELYKFDKTSTGQKTTLAAFMRNFCQPSHGIPPDAGTIYREMVSQPGVYWYLDCPFVDVIGLYSNIAEGPGYISGQKIGSTQKNWLVKTLKAIAKKRTQGARKALVVATHHPSLSRGGHGSSTDMLDDLDDAFNKTGIMPDAVFAAHAHNYQRFTRYVDFGGKQMEIPFYVAGIGGRGVSKVKKIPDGKRNGDMSFDNYFTGYGYLTITANANKLIIITTKVDNTGSKEIVETKTVDLNTNTIEK